MLRISGLLAIVLGVATLGSLAVPPAVSAGVSAQVRPIQLPAGELPLPPRVPKVLPSYCETHNCIVPPRNLGGR